MSSSRRARWGAVGALVLAGGLSGAVPPRPAVEGDGALQWWTCSTLQKVRPGDPPLRGPAVAQSAAARNEFEGVQLVLRSESAPVRRIDVEVSDFVGADGGTRLPSRLATVYLELFVDLDQPSSATGSAGEWPDPLVPRVDAYAGERRSAFPFDLPPGRSQPLWLEVYVPLDAAPGSYRAEITISVDGEPRGRVPWDLRVRDFALPSTSSLPNSFGFSGVSALRGHFGRYTDDADLLRLTRIYTIAGLRHRLSFHVGSGIPPRASFTDASVEIDWSEYDREVGPTLDGTLFAAGDPLPGARATSIDVRTPGELGDARTILYWRGWAEHFEARGWLDRLFLYLWDEPETSHYPEVLARGRLARRADPRLTVLLTEPWTPHLAEVVDVWVPLINCALERAGDDNPCGVPMEESSYAAARKRGGRVWWYQSCASHGCNIVGGRELEGWPSYAIDAPATAARRMPWLSWSEGFEGELYFNTVEAYASGPDPWVDSRRHGGNGDGSLFYPGTPERIGGATHIPIESVRLKLIRDGLEDYEYLVLLAARAGADRVRELSGAMVSPRLRGSVEPAAFERARDSVAAELETHLGRRD